MSAEEKSLDSLSFANGFMEHKDIFSKQVTNYKGKTIYKNISILHTLTENVSESTRPSLNGNNATETDHSRKGDLLLRPTCPSTVVSLSLKNRILSSRSFKWMKLYPILNLMKMLWALSQRVDLDHGWEFFQGLKFKWLKLFLKYHPTQSFGIKTWFSIFLKKLHLSIRIESNIFALTWSRKADTSF